VRARLTATAVAGSVAAALLVLPSGATAAAGPAAVRDRAAGAAGSTDPRALALLQRAVLAPATTSYSGTQFVSAWGSTGTTSALVDVEHLPGYGTVTRVVAAPGVASSSSYTPDQSVASDAPAAAALLGPLTMRHVCSLKGTASVAGRVSDVVEIRRVADDRVAARLWLDRATGVVLRREIYDAAGRIVRASAFIAVVVGGRRVPTHLPPMAAAPWQERLDEAALSSMRSKGWQAPVSLPGLSMYDARRSVSGGATTLHLGYSDGLSTVSVFEQRGHLDTHRLQGYTVVTRGGTRLHQRTGIPTELVWSADGKVYTVVADAPPEMVDAVVSSLPRADAEGGVGSRLGRGLGRVVAWFNPFD
jgi:sigma-E factor negative regulatory protein RseB